MLMTLEEVSRYLKSFSVSQQLPHFQQIARLAKLDSKFSTKCVTLRHLPFQKNAAHASKNVPEREPLKNFPIYDIL